MLHNVKQLYGKKLGAIDGDIGHIKDFYFDDKTWAVRYVVADTGSWLSGREILLSPNAFGTDAFGNPDIVGNALGVHLTRKQIEGSPSIDSHRPISRQDEEQYYNYYGWSGYWQDGTGWSGAGIPIVIPPTIPAPPPVPRSVLPEDNHLRSAKALVGYDIRTVDDTIGAVSSLMIAGKEWRVHELVIETGSWFSGKQILILTKNVTRIAETGSEI